MRWGQGNYGCTVAVAALYDTRPATGRVPEARPFERDQVSVVTLSAKDIEYIAHLARLEVDQNELPAYAEKLGKIIDFIDELAAADTGEILPMAHPLDMRQRLRADEVTETDQRDHYQENAPETSNGLYVVPRVVE